ncbi:methyl-accepting chemotaxis protein [Gorillibacterium sp. sgz5001074]|uniref:methyl-accepting chemotaxis protein n=1 Tax=Gorillibacterium sp. sgz5001074 TaxID=3446695 RepID=UPI003F681363
MAKLPFRFTLKTRLIASFTLITLVFAGVALYNSTLLGRIHSASEEQQSKTELQLKALEFKGTAQDIKDIASGLMISRKPEFVDKYKAKRPVFQQTVKDIADTAVTEEQLKWRSQLIMASTDYLNMFDQAVSILSDKSLKEIDVQKNTEYLYEETQKQRDKIFELVDKFYQDYSKDAAEATGVAKKKIDTARSVMNAATWFVLLLSGAIAAVIILSFTRKINRLQAAVATIAKGDLSHTIGSGSGDDDELGQLSRDFDSMVEKVRTMLSHTKSIAASLSEQSGRFERFSGDTATANSHILTAVHEIAQGADQQAKHAEDSSSIIEELDAEMSVIWEAAEAMRQTNATAEGNTRIGKSSMADLQAAAGETARTIAQVRSAISHLGASSKQIDRIVNSITEISAQTNILALNAAIEAARAGAQGRGFSVIAEEVRVLSQEAGDSSKSISQTIGSLQKQIAELERSIQEAQEVLENQDGQVMRTLRSFQAIEESMQEVTSRIDSIYDKLEGAKERNRMLVGKVQHVAAVAEETAAGVQEMTSTSIEQDASIRRIAEQAQEIREYSESLFREISQFRVEAEEERLRAAEESRAVLIG